MLSRPLVQHQGFTVPAFAAMPYLDQKSIGANVTVGNATLTVANFVGGIINRTGPVGGFTDTWPDADQFIAAMDNPMKGDSWMTVYRNGVAQAMTFAAGTGIISGIGTLSCAASSTKLYLHTILSVKRTKIIVGTNDGVGPILTGFSNADIANVEQGMGISGTGIPALATVLGATPSDTAGGATITISANTTSANVNTAFTFFPRIQVDALGVMTN